MTIGELAQKYGRPRKDVEELDVVWSGRKDHIELALIEGGADGDLAEASERVRARMKMALEA
jgi:hypothetical protein